LIVSGVTLLGFAGGARLTGELQKQRDLKRFDAALLAGSAPARGAGSANSAPGVDTSL
jgi:hypothetical protein